MQEIAKQIQQISTTVNLDLNADKLWQLFNQTGRAIKRWSSLLLGIILLGSWILLTVKSGNMFIKEVLITSFIIVCLIILKGPNAVENRHKSS